MPRVSQEHKLKKAFELLVTKFDKRVLKWDYKFQHIFELITLENTATNVIWVKILRA